jgi:hypothetical protein
MLIGFIHNKTLARLLQSYSFFLGTSLLKLSLFFFLANEFSQKSFIAYNMYLFYSEIILVLISSTTNFFFSKKSETKNRLSTSIIFENIYLLCVVFILVFSAIFNLINFDSYVSFPLLLFLVWGRLNNQIFSRYFLISSSINKSLWNDIFGNTIWIFIGLSLLFFYDLESPELMIVVWSIFLACNTFLNLYKLRKKISILKGWDNLKIMLGLYMRSVQFSTIFILYGSAEKLLMSSKFANNIEIVASYLMAAKVIGFMVELTSGFIGSVLLNNLKKIKDGSIRRNKMMVTAIILNILISGFIVLVVTLFDSTIQDILSVQMTFEYKFLLTYLALLYAVISLQKISNIYLQRIGRIHYLNWRSIVVSLGLAFAYFASDSIEGFISIQIASFILLLIVEAIFYFYRNKEACNDL